MKQSYFCIDVWVNWNTEYSHSHSIVQTKKNNKVIKLYRLNDEKTNKNDDEENKTCLIFCMERIFFKIISLC